MASIELARLLAELKKTASPVQRMKLMARAWRSVRRLAPAERQDLAAHVGLEGAEELLERLASRGGSRLSPSLLLRTLDRVRETEPAEVSRVVGTLRDPLRRKKLLKRGLEVLTGGPEPAEPVAQPAPAESVVEPTPTTPPAPRSDPPAEPEPEPEEQETEKPETMAPPGPPPPVVAPVPTPVPPPPPVPPVVAEEPVSELRSPAPPPEPVIAKEEEEGSSLVEGIRRTRSLTERFRLLRSREEDLHGLSNEQIGALLERFPAGWPRRRALAALLRAGVPETSQQAIDLIELLQSRSSRRWCASIVLDRWSLSADEREALIEQHDLFGRRT